MIEKDKKAQKELFDKYSRMIFTTIYRIINDYDTANDILQETFIDVFTQINELKNADALKSWINRIAVRKSVRYMQQTKTIDTIDDYPDIKSTDWNGDFIGEDLQKAIASLSDKNRMVFVLVEVEGYKHREVAEMMRISEGTSKSQLNYAKKLLRLKLSEIYNS